LEVGSLAPPGQFQWTSRGEKVKGEVLVERLNAKTWARVIFSGADAAGLTAVFVSAPL